MWAEASNVNGAGLIINNCDSFWKLTPGSDRSVNNHQPPASCQSPQSDNKPLTESFTELHDKHPRLRASRRWWCIDYSYFFMKVNVASSSFGLFCTNYDKHLSLHSIILCKSVDLCCKSSSEILSWVHKVSFVIINKNRQATGHKRLTLVCLITLAFVLIYTARVFSSHWEPSSGAESAQRCVRAASWLIPWRSVSAGYCGE